MRILFDVAAVCIFVGCILGCGDVTVNIDDTYVPKIVVEGYLMPERGVENVRITRNFALNREIRVDEMVLSDAVVALRDIELDRTWPLSYDEESYAYACREADLRIEYGKRYTLTVQATVDGQGLSTSSTTTIPQKGFSIVEEASRLEPMGYRERDSEGQLRKFTIAFERSPDVDSYIVSIVALDASRDTFIEDNIFGLDKDELDDGSNLSELQYNEQWSQTQLGGEGLSEIEVEWFLIWYYGSYRAIVYATDRNFKEYHLTYGRVQDIDGNLWEPKFHFEGDGIGVFGSAIADTVCFEVLR